MKEKIMIIKKLLFKFLKENKLIAIISASAILLIVLAMITMPYLSKNNNTENLSSNLNNFGFATKKGDWTYYLGYDNNGTDGIYKIKKDRQTPEKISENYGLYLNTEGNYIYFYDIQNYNLVKMPLAGGELETIVEKINSIPINVDNDWIYYFKNYKFYRIKTNGKDEVQLSDEKIIAYQIEKDLIYYVYENDANKYSIAKMNTKGENVTEIDSDSGNIFKVEGNMIYYIYSNFDEENNIYTYDFYKIKTNGKSKEKIKSMDGDISYANITSSGLYYLKADGDDKYSIYNTTLNGKEDKKVVDILGDRNPINVIDNYIYYIDNNAQDDMVIFRIKTNGQDKQELSIAN